MSGVRRDEIFDEGLDLLPEGRVVDFRALGWRDQEDDVRRVVSAEGLVGVAGAAIGFRRGVEPTALTQMLAEVETV